MVQIIWTPRFRRDLRKITFYLEMNSLGAASRFVSNLHEKLKLLQAFPEMGRIVPEESDRNLRELIMGRYRIVYLIASNGDIFMRQMHNSAKKKLSLE